MVISHIQPTEIYSEMARPDGVEPPTAWFMATPLGLCIYMKIIIIPSFSSPINFRQVTLDGLI